MFFVAGGSVLYLQDQYINHIVNETGATVILRGCGSGNFESMQAEGIFMLHNVSSFSSPILA